MREILTAIFTSAQTLTIRDIADFILVLAAAITTVAKSISSILDCISKFKGLRKNKQNKRASK